MRTIGFHGFSFVFIGFSLVFIVFPLVFIGFCKGGRDPGARGLLVTQIRVERIRVVRLPVEVMPVERINEAVARVRAGDARYRVVLESSWWAPQTFSLEA